MASPASGSGSRSCACSCHSNHRSQQSGRAHRLPPPGASSAAKSLAYFHNSARAGSKGSRSNKKRNGTTTSASQSILPLISMGPMNYVMRPPRRTTPTGKKLLPLAALLLLFYSSSYCWQTSNANQSRQQQLRNQFLELRRQQSDESSPAEPAEPPEPLSSGGQLWSFDARRQVSESSDELSSSGLNEPQYSAAAEFSLQPARRQLHRPAGGTSGSSKRRETTPDSAASTILSQQHVIVDHAANLRRQNRQRLVAAGLIQQAPSVGFGASGSRTEADVETFYIRKGANGTLPCLPVLPADSQTAMDKIEWFKEDKKLVEAQSKQMVVWNAKNTIAYLPESAALLFRGVINEDSGEYHCLLTKQSTGEIEDGVVRFYVQDVPDPPQQPVVIAFTQRSISISWVPGHDYHFSPILHYIIHVREGINGQWDVSNGVMTPDNRTQFEIIGLKPFTTYSFRVLAVNAIGVSEPSPISLPFKTLRQKPDSRLTIISARNISSNAIKLEWLPPSVQGIHGEFLGYRIRYVHQLHEHAPPSEPAFQANSSLGDGQQLQHQHQQQQYPSSRNRQQQKPIEQPSLDGPQAKEIIVGDPSQTSFVVKGLNTFTPYKFSVQVSNPAGEGPVAEVLAMTDEGVPSPPMELGVVKTMDTTVKLRWSEPRAPNGILQGYQINLHDVGQNLNDTRKLSDPQSVMEHTIGELTPFTWYKVSIQAYSRKFLGEPSQLVKFRTDVSAPSAPLVLNVTCYSQDSIQIQWQRPERFFNQIDYYYVEYKAPDSSDQSIERTLVAKKEKSLSELLITNLTAGLLYELKVFAGTKSILDPNHIYRSDPSQTMRVVLQANCESYTAYPSTESTFNTSLAIGVVCASFALALVTAALVVWRRHCQAAYYYLDDPQSQASRGTNSPQLSETYDGTEYGSVPVNDWTKHVQKLHVDSDIGFSREFEQIQQSSSANLTCEHSQMPENKHKNRYINIVAYDHTRVTLRTFPGQKKPGADYINANFIDGYNKPRAYIGTQGPLVSTFDDYWRMIWEQRVVIIVMITNLQERGRRKCDMYWPKEGTETYGYVQVKLLQEVVMATYTLRTFTVKNLKMKKRSIGSERTVYQYHYTNWPDHGVPDHPLPVLSFVRKSASANPAGAGAIICHCSAGCGRSGTYIVIDAMLKQIRHRQSINVVDFLKHIRSQRNYLVQTEEQYIFIHDALVVAIDSGETEIASNCIAKYIQLLQTGGGGTATLSQKDSTYSITNGLQSPQQHLLQQQQALSVSADSGNQLIGSQSNLLPLPQASGGKTGAGGGNNTLKGSTGSSAANNGGQRSQSGGGGGGAGQWSLLERQYRLLTKFDANDFAVVSALKPCNRNKNRTINIIPIEGHRVHITPKAGADGSDYINASFLMGFNHLREFIVTQHPVLETFSDFWQMVYDHNSQTIVLLTQMADQLKEFPQFWPQKEDEVDYGSFKVKLTQESTLMKAENGGLIITRDFIMRSNQDDYELQTRVIHCPGWPECCGPLGGVFDLIQVVQNATQQQASQQKMHDGLTNTTTVTIGQEHEPQNGGPIIVVDKFGGTEAATFAVLTTLFKQINFEDAVDVYMYAKLAHQQRPGIWRSQDDYLFLYRAIESYASSMAANEAANQSNQKLLSSATTGGIANFHHQTMTLDRHKHKSQSAASKSMNTSTMRRGTSNQRDNNNNNSGRDIRDPQQPIVELSKSNNQIVQLDQNHNSAGVVSSQQQLIGLQRALVQPPQQQQLLLQRQQLNSVGQQQLKSMQSNSSPYSSAISIGTSPHQHLLASNGRGANSSLVGAPAKPQQSQQQQLVGDHYLYTMN